MDENKVEEKKVTMVPKPKEEVLAVVKVKDGKVEHEIKKVVLNDYLKAKPVESRLEIDTCLKSMRKEIELNLMKKIG